MANVCLRVNQLKKVKWLYGEKKNLFQAKGSIPVKIWVKNKPAQGPLEDLSGLEYRSEHRALGQELIWWAKLRNLTSYTWEWGAIKEF